MKYCCDNFKYSINKGTELGYEPHLRWCYLKLQYDDAGCTAQDILYCPWCGKKLPKSLDKEWSKVLKKEFNITDPILHEYEDGSTAGGKEPVPPEFKTDEWWKKRGL